MLNWQTDCRTSASNGDHGLMPQFCRHTQPIQELFLEFVIGVGAKVPNLLFFLFDGFSDSPQRVSHACEPSRGGAGRVGVWVHYA